MNMKGLMNFGILFLYSTHVFIQYSLLSVHSNGLAM